MESVLNVKNLKVGQVVKNYKEMCSLLGQNECTGNAQKAQIKEWQRYFDFEKEGQKFVVIEVYDNALDRQDARTDGNNTVYVKYIELLLMIDIDIANEIIQDYLTFTFNQLGE